MNITIYLLLLWQIIKNKRKYLLNFFFLSFFALFQNWNFIKKFITFFLFDIILNFILILLFLLFHFFKEVIWEREVDGVVRFEDEIHFRVEISVRNLIKEVFYFIFHHFHEICTAWRDICTVSKAFSGIELF